MRLQDYNNILSGNDNGLTIVPVPTGTSKTYSMMEYFAENSKRGKRKLIFCTNKNNNLPISTLRAIWKERRPNDCFDDFVLELKSNFNSVKDNFDADIIDESFVNVNKNLINRIKDQLKLLDKNGDLAASAETILRNGDSKIGDKTGLVVQFQRAVIRFITRSTGRGLSNHQAKADRLDKIKKDPKYQWISKIYPEVFIDDYPIIFMNTSKYTTSYQSFVDGSKMIASDSELLDGSLIVFDEFDQTKDVFMNSIIENTVKNKGNLFKDVMDIHRKLVEVDITKSNRIIHDEKHKRSITKSYRELIKEFENLKSKYHVDAAWYMPQKNLNKQYIFVDGKNIQYSINDQKIKVIYKYMNESNEVKIVFEDKKDASETSDINLISTFISINMFLSSVRRFISDITKYHIYEAEKEMSNYDPKTSYDEILNSVLSYYSIDSNHLRTLLFEDFYSSNKNFGKSSSKKLPTFYDHGLQLIALENSSENVFLTNVSRYFISLTPENIIASRAEKSCVIGLSATANMESPLSNYDLNYFRQKLQNSFHDATNYLTEDTKRELHILSNCYESKVPIDVQTTIKIVDLIDRYGTDELTSIEIKEVCLKCFGDRPEIFQIVFSNLRTESEPYILKRYLEIVKAMLIFFDNENIESFLCLTNKGAYENDPKLDKNVCQTIFDLLASFLKKDNQLARLDTLVGKRYLVDKDRILTNLSNGVREFVISTYKTIGDGQNLDYKPHSVKGLIQIVDKGFSYENDQRFNKKDFDAIYLGDVTNITTNLLDDNLKISDLLNYLIQVKELSAVGDLNWSKEQISIVNGLKKISYGNTAKIHSTGLNYTLSARRLALRDVIQATGRLTRSFMKRHVFILISADLITKLPVSDLKMLNIKNLLTEEMKAIMRKLCEERNLQVEDATFQVRAMNKDLRYTRHLDKLRAIFNSTEISDENEKKNAMMRYEHERNMMLKKPVIYIQKSAYDPLFDSYIDIDDGNKYFIHVEDENVDKISTISTSICHEEVSEETSRLSTFMKNKVVREYFKENNFATNFKLGNKIMNPTMFQNMYKGVLGEKAGVALLNHYLSSKFELKRFDDVNNFELFDYKLVDKDIYFDFKNWKYSFDQNYNEQIENVYRKLKKIGAKRVFIINMVSDGDYKIRITNDKKVIILPSLINSKGETNYENIQFILKYIN